MRLLLLFLFFGFFCLHVSVAQTPTLIKNIFYPDYESGISTSSTPHNMVKVNGIVIFTAVDGTHGRELWRTDGSTNGTYLIKDINPGYSDSGVQDYYVSDNGTLLFGATDGINGYELWRSDGTEDGTYMLKDIIPGDTGGFNGASGNVSSFYRANNLLYFVSSNGQLWRTDGTGSGTFMINDVDYQAGHRIENITLAGATLFFTKYDSRYGTELWRSDGTIAGTYLVKDINSGEYSSDPGLFTNVNGVLFFRATGNDGHVCLWRSDGTTNGTVVVKDFYMKDDYYNPNPNYRPYSGREMSNFTNVNGVLYFTAYNTIKRQTNYIYGTLDLVLWRSDGTSEGTYILKNSDYLGNLDGRLEFSNFKCVNGKLFYEVTKSGFSGEYKRELWSSDGTSSSTQIIKQVDAKLNIFNALTPKSNIFFYFMLVNYSSNKTELWRTDGTVNGTIELHKNLYDSPEFSNNLYPYYWLSLNHFMEEINGVSYFVAYNVKEEICVYRTNGTIDGTYSIHSSKTKKQFIGSNIPYFIVTGIPGNNTFLTKNETIFFNAPTLDSLSNNYELWQSNGTISGTHKISDSNIYIHQGTNLGETTILSAWISQVGYELYKLRNSSIIHHYHQLPQHAKFNQRKLLATDDPFKVCADGSAASIFKFSEKQTGDNYNNFTVRIKENPSNSGPDTLTNGRFVETLRYADSLVVRYRNPGYIVTNTDSKTLTIELVKTGTENVVDSYELVVYRAPVVMVHGLWSSKESFAAMEQHLLQSNAYSSFLLKRVDYSATNFQSFSMNVPQIPVAIEDHLENLRSRGIAAGKVDYVAHSMGGILGRLYLQKTNYQDDLRRMITINTPHSGSQLGNLYHTVGLQHTTDVTCHYILQSLLTNTLCEGGAVKDLQVDGPAILNDLNGPRLNIRTVPSHTIATVQYNQPSEVVTPALKKAHKTILFQLLFLRYGISSTLFGDVNDWIVARNSQTGGLMGLQSTLIEEQIHLGSPANPAVMERVKNLLLLSPDSPSFAKNGFVPTRLGYTLHNPLGRSATEKAGSITVFPTDTIRFYGVYAPIQTKATSSSVNIVKPQLL